MFEAGDEGLLLVFGQGLDAAVNERVQGYGEAVRRAGIPGVRDVVPGYLSLLVTYDAGKIDGDDLRSALAALRPAARAIRPPRHHEVPVCYGGSFGPDLEEVAAKAGLTPEDVVGLHAGQEYRVYCLGFAPGFPYCAELPTVLRLPRRPEPRLKVPRGSVGIAGLQTGIYPLETSGGWHLLGRTPWTVFDWTRPEPARILPGDTVCFRPIAEGEFRQLEAMADSGDGSRG